MTDDEATGDRVEEVGGSNEESAMVDDGWQSALDEGKVVLFEAKDETREEIAPEPVGAPKPGPRLDGVWTVAQGAELLERVRGWCTAGGRVEVECGNLERVDVSALQVLVAARRHLAEGGGSLALVNLPPRIAESLRWAALATELSSWT